MPAAIINGLDHYYEYLGSGRAVGHAAGAFSSSQSLVQHFPELSAHYRIIAPDRRGMGRSAHVPDMPPSLPIERQFTRRQMVL